MLNSKKVSYTVKLSETGIQTEIYLPKRSYFQGTLYSTLTKGFDHEHVKKTLLENINEIENLMDKFTVPLISKGFKEERIAEMKQIFWGYSIYEVDGVFVNDKKRIDDERTQVIRIMLSPDIEDIQKSYSTEKKVEEPIKNIEKVGSFLK